jgi:hypothetical protein
LYQYENTVPNVVENIGSWFEKRGEKKLVEYLDELERMKFEVEIIDGLIYVNGAVYSSPIDENGNIKESIFVISSDDKLYISHLQEKNIFHHSSFVEGAEVKAAGEIIVIDGVIAIFDYNSGHYKPSITSYYTMRSFLIKAGYSKYLPSFQEFREAYVGKKSKIKQMPMIKTLLNQRKKLLDCKNIYR